MAVDEVGVQRMPDEHPMLSTSYEEAIATPSLLVEPLRQEGGRALRTLLKVVKHTKKAAKLVSARTEGDRVTLVFSPEARDKLRDGTWHLALDGKTGLTRAEARDDAQRIRETAKIGRPGVGVEQAIAGVVAIAHVISAMDMQRSLERIDHKLDWLRDFLVAEREGELRGVYLSVQKALANGDEASRRDSLARCASKLDELQGRYFESAQACLRKIEDPAKIGVIKAITTRQATAERELRERLGGAVADLQRSEFCMHLNSIVHLELGEGAAIRAQQRALASSYAAVRELLVAKVAYIDRDLASKLDERSRAVEALGEDSLFDASHGLTLVLEGGADDDR